MTFIGGDQLGLFGAPAVEVDDAPEVTAGAWPRDCANPDGIRPCPRVSCRHHLLLDEVYSGPAPALAINRAGSLVQLRGRRPELAADATRAEVDAFADAAVEALWRLPDTCAREVAHRHRLARPDAFEAMTWDEIAVVLGVADEDELIEEYAGIVDGLRGEVFAAGGDPGVDDEAIAAVVARAGELLARRTR